MNPEPHTHAVPVSSVGGDTAQTVAVGGAQAIHLNRIYDRWIDAGFTPVAIPDGHLFRAYEPMASGSVLIYQAPRPYTDTEKRSRNVYSTLLPRLWGKACLNSLRDHELSNLCYPFGVGNNRVEYRDHGTWLLALLPLDHRTRRLFSIRCLREERYWQAFARYHAQEHSSYVAALNWPSEGWKGLAWRIADGELESVPNRTYNAVDVGEGDTRHFRGYVSLSPNHSFDHRNIDRKTLELLTESVVFRRPLNEPCKTGFPAEYASQCARVARTTPALAEPHGGLPKGVTAQIVAGDIAVGQGLILDGILGPSQDIGDHCLTSTATAIARQMYETNDFDASPILADALEDAGCEHELVLNRLRNPPTAIGRGDWIIDRLLGKAKGPRRFGPQRPIAPELVTVAGDRNLALCAQCGGSGMGPMMANRKHKPCPMCHGLGVSSH